MAGAVDLSLYNSYEEMIAATTQAVQDAVPQFDRLQKSITDIGESVAKTFNKLALAITGLATAGIAGTQEAGRLGIAWTLLTRQIASAALPVIDALTRGMRMLSDYMAGLTGDGQRVVLIFGGLAVIVPVITRLFGLLHGVFSPIYVVVGMLVESLYQFFTRTAEGQSIMSAIGSVMAFVTPIMRAFKTAFELVVDALVVGFQAVIRAGMFMAIKLAELAEFIASKLPGIQADAMKMAFHAMGHMWQRQLNEMMAQGWGAKAAGNGGGDGRRDVSPNNFRFEAIGAAMERITLAANKTGADPVKIAQDQLAQQEMMVPLLGGILQAQQRQQPAIGR